MTSITKKLVKQALLQQSLTLRDVAARLEISHGTAKNAIYDTKKYRRTFIRICELLGVPHGEKPNSEGLR